MPRGDGNGPLGQGPMTGGAFGYCAGYDMPGFANPVARGTGRSMAWGRGGGLGLGLARRRGCGGFARRFAGVLAAAPVADEKTALQSRLSALETAASAIRQRLDGLSTQSE